MERDSESKGNLSVFSGGKNPAYTSFHIGAWFSQFSYSQMHQENEHLRMQINKLGSDPQNVAPHILIMYQIKETGIKIKTDPPSVWQFY